jgi:hypothetical protein
LKNLAFLLLCASIIFVARPGLSDGLPQGNAAKPTPVIMPLDEAINQIESKDPPTEQEIKTETVIEQTEPAQEIAAPVPDNRIVEVQPNTSFFGMSVGVYDVGRSGDRAPAISAEWQPGVKIAGFLQPIFGAFATTKATAMGYGGVGVPIKLSKHFFLMPSVAVGAYKEGAGYDLGKTLAFRVGTELGYQFDDQSRLGLNAHIITNGESTNKIDRTHIISLVYTMPTTFLSGRSKKIDVGPAIPPQE